MAQPAETIAKLEGYLIRHRKAGKFHDGRINVDKLHQCVTHLASSFLLRRTKDQRNY